MTAVLKSFIICTHQVVNGLRRIGLAGHVACMCWPNLYNISARTLPWKSSVERPRHRGNFNVWTDLRETGWQSVGWIKLHWVAVSKVVSLQVKKTWVTLLENQQQTFTWLCHNSDSWFFASHCGGPDSIPGQSTWDLQWTKWHWGRTFSEQFSCPLKISFPSNAPFSHLTSGAEEIGSLCMHY
jgi:hypothetical protein